MINILVGVERFELPTSWSQTRRATRLRYTPRESHSTPEGVSEQCKLHLIVSEVIVATPVHARTKVVLIEELLFRWRAVKGPSK